MHIYVYYICADMYIYYMYIYYIHIYTYMCIYYMYILYAHICIYYICIWYILYYRYVYILYAYMYIYIYSIYIRSVQFSSVAQLCPTLFNSMNRSTPGLPVHHKLLEFTQTHVMPSSHLILCRPLLLLPPIPPSIRVFSNESTLCMRWPKYSEFQL